MPKKVVVVMVTPDGMTGMSRDGEESVLFVTEGGERRCFTRLYDADVLAYGILPTHGETGLKTLLPQRSLCMPLWRFLEERGWG